METYNYKLAYAGKGSDLFKIWIVNAILCTLTLGLYYPWAKAKTRQYLYSQTTFEGQPFVFTGTGKEMFKGFVKLIVLIMAIVGLSATLVLSGGAGAQLGFLFAYLAFIALIPFAVHGAFRYRMAKSNWRGINFQYTGRLGEIVSIFYKGLFFTIVTLGFYGAWLAMDMRRYVLDNVKIGDARFSYTGNGTDYFVMNLKNYFLTLFTVGIYYFWWRKDIFAFFVNNLKLTKDEETMFFESTATGGDFFGLLIVNGLITIFTLGFGIPWVTTRTLEFVANHINMNGTLDLDNLNQDADGQFSDATGDDLASMLDIGATI
jgi:uncharacterized membrane protein YjgN (DUF898 family)